MFTEGILVDEKSKEWGGIAVFDVVKDVNGDEQLLEISGQPRADRLSSAIEPDDIFPNSIIIVREDVLDIIFQKLARVFGGHQFPTQACFIILKERNGEALARQLKRDIGLNPDIASNPAELSIAIKSHLNDMDPGARNGRKNLHEFEEEISDLSNGSYSIVPDEWRNEEDEN